MFENSLTVHPFPTTRQNPTAVLRQAWLSEPEKNFRPGEVFLSYSRRALIVEAILADDFILNSATEENAALWKTGDVFELFLQPCSNGPYYEFHVTPENVHLQFSFHPEPDGTFSRKFTALPPGSFNAETKIAPSNQWQVKAEIPFSLLGVSTPSPGDIWKGNFCRYDAGTPGTPTILSASAPLTVCNFHDRSAWHTLLFAE